MTLVFFTLATCAPCRLTEHIVLDLVRRTGARLVRVNYHSRDGRSWAMRLGITMAPTLLAYQEKPEDDPGLPDDLPERVIGMVQGRTTADRYLALLGLPG